jgi:UDP:flavonoid glycosyltransferase YjiC (YdhE family)
MQSLKFVVDQDSIIFKMKPRLFIFPFHLLSHYLRCIALAKKWSGTYEIWFAGSSKYEDYITKEGFRIFNFKGIDEHEVMKSSNQFLFDWLNEKNLESQFLEQIQIIQTYQPEVVMGDMSVTLKMAAEYCKVKYISLVNSYMTPYYLPVRKISRKHPNYKIVKYFPAPILNPLTKLIERIYHYKIHKAFKLLRSQYSLQSYYFFLDELQGDETLICDDVVLFPLKKTPPTYRVIGPLIYQVDEEEATLVAQLRPDKKTVVVTMGSTGNWKEVAFLNDEKYNIFNLVILGDSKNILYQPWMIKKSFADLEKILPHSSLLIFHGGNGTLYTGIKFKVKMKCYPSHFEQEWNVDRLEKKGWIDHAVLI